MIVSAREEIGRAMSVADGLGDQRSRDVHALLTHALGSLEAAYDDARSLEDRANRSAVIETAWVVKYHEDRIRSVADEYSRRSWRALDDGDPMASDVYGLVSDELKRVIGEGPDDGLEEDREDERCTVAICADPGPRTSSSTHTRSGDGSRCVRRAGQRRTILGS